MRHDGHFSSPLPCFVRVGLVVSCCFLVGEVNFDLFLTSSNNLTATVESNAAIEKKTRGVLCSLGAPVACSRKGGSIISAASGPLECDWPTFFFFFLYCRIALDSCGQVIARSQKEIEIQLTYKKATRNNQPNTNKTRRG